jgi:murein DD-endopeptidase MepM/ murein hydrolase activator NlpD
MVSQMRRRIVLATAGGALAACAAPGPAPQRVAPKPAPPQAPPAEVAPPPPAPTAVTVPPPAPAPPPAPRPSLVDLGVERLVQPQWAGEGDRILLYDQPQPGMGGTWAVDPVTGQRSRERAQWGSFAARGTLQVTPRPAQRDTLVLHLPSGREWALPTSSGTLFSPDGTVVAYNSAAPTQGGGGGGPNNFQTTTLTVSGADGQGPRRLPLPLNASPVAFLPGADGTPNARLLLSGRRSRQDWPALWVLDVRSGALVDFARSRRLVGLLPSPDGTWLAYVAMWNPDPSQNGLWVTRTDGSERRRIDLLGGYRWTADNRLFLIPVRPAGAEGHEVWEVTPASGESRRLTDATQTPFRVTNYDWDLSPDGTTIVFVSDETRRLTSLVLPRGLHPAPGTPPSGPPAPAPGSAARPYRLPFASAPGPGGWYLAQWYGVTTGGYRGRNSAYRQGQGIHFGIDFAAPLGTPVVAMGPGRVIAIDGGYGSPPHNLVIQLADGNQAMYGHLLEASRHVQVGQAVEAGQVVGNTGDSSSPYDGFGNPHLHLEIRKRGRAVATNPVPLGEAIWDDLGLGTFPGPRFQRDLDNPRSHQFPDDQPDIWFGGPVITNFARPWPP